MFLNYSVNLCKHVILKQQNDLSIIFENFIDNVSDPENNIFFMQNEILDKMMSNIEKSKKDIISLEDLYEGITEEEKIMISSLKMEKKLKQNSVYSKLLGIEYFDEELFMLVLDNSLKEIVSKYNLKANDDYNKLYNFLSSIKLTLQSSDDVLSTLKNQYIFFNDHAKSSKYHDEEFITIYGNKHYKIDILKTLIEKYNKKTVKVIKKKNIKK